MTGEGPLARYTKCLIVASIFLSALNLLPTLWWPQEMLATLAPYFLVLHVVSVLLIVAFWKRFQRSRALIVACLAALSVNICFDLAPYYLAGYSAPADTPSVKIYYANLRRDNRSFGEVQKQIADEAPDIVALLETDNAWLSSLGLRERFTAVKEIPRDDNFGMALYSKYPFEGQMIDDIGYEQPPVILTAIRLPERVVTVALMHARPPLSQEALKMNKVLVRRLSLQLRERDTAVILAGDLNGTVFSSNYARLVHASDLTNAANGYGFRKTWLAGSPIFHTAIDHLMTRGFDVVSWKVGDPIGSDHLPLVAELAAAAPVDRVSVIPRF